MPRKIRKKRSAMQVAKLALSRSRPPRLRRHPSSGSDPVLNTWTQIHITGLVEGDGEANREGSRVHIKHVGLRYSVTAAGALDATANVRVMLVQDKQTNGGTFGTANLFITDDSVKSFRDPTLQPSRFRVLYDKTFSLEEYAANSSIRNTEFHKFGKGYKSPLKMVWNGSGSGVGTVDKGAIFLMFMCDRVSNQPSIDWQTLVRFYSP